MPKDIRAVVLAGGLGTRMKSDLPKVLHPLRGRPMIEYVLDALRSSGVNDIICVTGHKSGMIEKLLKNVRYARQRKPLGSADALSQAKELLKNFTGDILVLYGDDPLIKSETLTCLINEHRRGSNFCTLLTTRMANPTGYGRIVRNDNGNIIKIIEETEASVYEKAIEEVNAGVYCFRGNRFLPLLGKIKNNNKKGEYFLTDIVPLMNKENLRVGSFTTDDSDEALGINSRIDLSFAEKILQKRILANLMNSGVTVVDPDSTYIDINVSIERDTTLFPHTIIEEGVKIGRDCRIGPFARIRRGCELKDGVEIGNFVELVRTRIDKETRVKHHAYLGDAVVGKNVNIGAGTVTANYDGKKKNVTRIDDGAFIGVGTILIAPVKVGKNAATGAGAVVTKDHDVPANSIVVGIPAKVLKKR